MAVFQIDDDENGSRKRSLHVGVLLCVRFCCRLVCDSAAGAAAAAVRMRASISVFFGFAVMVEAMQIVVVRQALFGVWRLLWVRGLI